MFQPLARVISAPVLVAAMFSPAVPVAARPVRPVAGQEAPASQSIGAGVRRGKLPSGFGYVLDTHPDGSGKVEVRLVVRVGNRNQLASQQEYAHLLEHVLGGWTGSAGARRSVRDLTTGWNMAPGDFNAQTNVDNTSYYYLVDRAHLPAALALVRGLVQGDAFTCEEVANEIKAVETEARIAPAPALNSLYTAAGIDWVGTTASRMAAVRQIDCAALRRFYSQWYRPDLATLIVAGDVDADTDALERKVRALFADLRSAGARPPRVEHDPRAVSRHVGVFDPSFARPDLKISFAAPRPPVTTVAGLRDLYIDRLLAALLAARVERATARYGNPIALFNASVYQSGSSSSMMWLPPTTATIDLYLSAPLDSMASATEKLFAMLGEAARYGFSEAEVARAKQRQRLTAALPKDPRWIAIAYGDAAERGDTLVPTVRDAAQVERLIASIRPEDVDRAARKWFDLRAMYVIAEGPEAARPVLGDAKLVRSWIDKGFAEAKQRDAGWESEPAIPALKLDFPPVAVVPEPQVSEGGAGTTVLRYPGNGATVILKPLPDSSELRISAANALGGRLYGDDRRALAPLAAGAVMNSGVGGLDKFQLGRFLKERGIQADVQITDRDARFQAAGKPGQAEALLDLLWLYFHNARVSPEAFADFAAQRARSGKAADGGSLDARADALLEGARLAADGESLGDAAKLTELFQDQFANPREFLFVVAGKFDVEGIRPQIDRLVGTLPAVTGASRVASSTPRARPAPGDYSFPAAEDNASVRFQFAMPLPYSARDAATAAALGSVMEHRVVLRLREKEEGVYWAFAAGSVRRDQNLAELTISFQCKPGDVERLTAATLDEIERLKRDSVTAEEAGSFPNAVARLTPSTAGEWAAYIRDRVNGTGGPIVIPAPEAVTPTAAEVQAMAAKLLVPEHRYRFVMKPQAVGGAAPSKR